MSPKFSKSTLLSKQTGKLKYVSDFNQPTGPYQVNGVPLRRVPQSYVIATETKIDIGSLKVDKDLNDEFFKRQKTQKKRTDDMFEQSVEVNNDDTFYFFFLLLFSLF